jgi:hypothetical protein
MNAAFPLAPVLLAATPLSAPLLLQMLPETVCPVVAYSEEEALNNGIRGIRLVICTMRFDESRMLEFVPHAARAFPGVPCICCRATEGELPQSSLRAARIAAANLGAVEFIDVPELRARYGDEGASDLFREIVGRHLGHQDRVHSLIGAASEMNASHSGELDERRAPT